MSEPLLRFYPVFPVAFVVATTVVLLAIFIYFEFQRRQKFLPWRIVASAVAMISLLGLLLNPTYREIKKSAPILLLTKGYLQDKVDSVIQKNPGLQVIRTKDAEAYKTGQILESWFELINKDICCVAGQGIPPRALDLLHHRAFRFFPAPLPWGVTRLVVPDNIYVNDQTVLRGTLNTSEKMKLKLMGPGGNEDSVTLNKGHVSFSLSFTPRQSGKFIYSLMAENLSGSTTVGRLPVVVMPDHALRILFIQKFPTAEVRYLKNFLAEKKHQVAVRYQVSKSNFTYEYANIPHFRIDRLGSDLLGSLDLLFMDQQSYDDLSLFEKNDVKKSIANGLGVIFSPHDPTDKVFNEFFPLKSRTPSTDTVHLRLLRQSQVLPVLPIELRTDAALLAVTKNKNRVLSGYFFSGSGKIGIQLIQETYRLVAEGNAKDYASLWRPLIRNAARTKESNFKIRLGTPFPYYADEPIEIEVISSGLSPSLYTDSVRIPMKENTMVDDCWRGESWANQIGWHRLHIEQDSTQLNYFVSDTSEWKALKISNQVRSNRILGNSSIAYPNNLTQQAPVPAILFYFLFLFSSAFLWLAPKM